MTSLAGELSRLVGQAFAAEGLSEHFGLVQVSDRPDLAQSVPARSSQAIPKRSVALKRGLQANCGTRAIARNYFERSPEILRPPVHAKQTIAALSVSKIESVAVVGDSQLQRSVPDL